MTPAAPPPLRALVTAGGTREPVDDVRVLTNLSTGRFGAAIANALVARGVETVLLGSRALLGSRIPIDPRVRGRPYGSFGDLARELEESCARTRPDLVFMAAAVSDYAPVPVVGKIRSTEDELVLRLVRNPKLLVRLRDWCGSEALLVGFKLLSGVSRDELVETARRQVLAARLDLTVANDLAELGGGQHPICLVAAKGAPDRIEGARERVAARLVDAVLERRGRPARAWSFAAGGAHPLSVAGLDLEAEIEPPPLDARYLERWIPGVDAFAALRARSATWVRPTARAPLPAAPGSPDEAAAVAQALAIASLVPGERRFRGGSFAVELPEPRGDARLLLGLEADAGLSSQWAEVSRQAEAWVREGGGELALSGAVFRPVLAGARVVGALVQPRSLRSSAAPRQADASDAPWQALFLAPAERGQGIGDDLLERLEEDPARRPLAVPRTDARARAYCLERGWRALPAKGSDEPSAGETAPGTNPGPVWELFEPPSAREDVQLAASVCLVTSWDRRVLLGRRFGAGGVAGGGAWAFPGGRVEPGEAPLTAALRELDEETGLQWPESAPPLRTRRVYAAGPSGQTFAITNVVFVTPRALPLRPSPELAAEWIPIDEAERLRPMTAGTRRVLRQLRLDPPW